MQIVSVIAIILVALIAGYVLGGLIYSVEGPNYLAALGATLAKYQGLVGGICTIVAALIAWMAVQAQIRSATRQVEERERRRLAALAVSVANRLTLIANVEKASLYDRSSVPDYPFVPAVDMELAIIDPMLAACLPAIADNLHSLKAELVTAHGDHLGFQRRARAIAARCDSTALYLRGAAAQMRRHGAAERPYASVAEVRAIFSRYQTEPGETFLEYLAG